MKKNNDNEIKRTAHSKYRRQIIYGKIKKDVSEMIRKLCVLKIVEIIEAEACKDHVYLLLVSTKKPPAVQVGRISLEKAKKKTSVILISNQKLDTF